MMLSYHTTYINKERKMVMLISVKRKNLKNHLDIENNIDLDFKNKVILELLYDNYKNKIKNKEVLK